MSSIYLDAGSSGMSIRADRPTIARSLARQLAQGEDGALVAIGDEQYTVDALTVTFTVGGGDAAQAWTDLQAALAIIRAAHAMRVGDADRWIYLAGPTEIRRQALPLAFRLQVNFQPDRSLTGSTGSGETLTLSSQALTFNGIPLHMEVG